MSKRFNIKKLIQRFFSVMFVFVLFFFLSGLVMVIVIVLKNPIPPEIDNLQYFLNIWGLILISIVDFTGLTFLFIVPIIFCMNSFLAMFLFVIGIIGDHGSNIFEIVVTHWAVAFMNNPRLVFIYITIGTVLTVLYFFMFKFCLEKWDTFMLGRVSKTENKDKDKEE